MSILKLAQLSDAGVGYFTSYVLVFYLSADVDKPDDIRPIPVPIDLSRRTASLSDGRETV